MPPYKNRHAMPPCRQAMPPYRYKNTNRYRHAKLPYRYRQLKNGIGKKLCHYKAQVQVHTKIYEIGAKSQTLTYV